MLFFLLFSVGFGVSASTAAELSSDQEYNTPGNGSLTDQNIQYIGRWDKRNADYIQSHWLGAYIRVDFTGNSIKINMEGNRWLIVQIDNETPRTIYAGNGTELSAGNLAEGRHTILVGASELINNQLTFKGFTLASGAVTYKSDKKLLFEFIGDSITSGGGTFPKDIYNFVWLLSNRLGCDHTQISYPGLALCTGYTYYSGAARNTGQAVGMDQLYFSMKDLPNFVEDGYTVSVPWTMNTYTPDVVFMFLGTNDSSNGGLYSTDASPLLFKQKVGELFSSIRTNYPETHLICMTPFSGVYKSEISTKIQEMRNSGDKKVHVINTTGWLNSTDFTDGIHLSSSGTAKVVDKLYDILSPLKNSIETGTDYEIPNELVTDEKFYLIPSAQWKESDASFGAIFKNGDTEEKVMFVHNNSIEKYELPVPAGNWPQICMKRYSSAGTADWGGFSTYNQSTQKHENNFIPYDKVFNCIEIIGWADGTAPNGYILSNYPDLSSTGITIRFKKPSTWGTVNIHAWDAVGVALPGFNWPGNPMIEENSNPGWYYYTFEPSVKFVSFQFNKGDADGLIVKEAVTESASYDENGNTVTTIKDALADSGAEKPFIRAENNLLSASFAGSADVKLYSITGRLLYAGTAVNEFTYYLNQGVYLLSIDHKIYKVKN
jgi:hypothetical protein